MQKLYLAFSISLLFASTAIANETQPDVRFELVDDLTACVAKLDVAYDNGHTVEGLATMRVSTKGALKFLLGDDGFDADRRRAARDISAEFSQDLQLNPMNARTKVRTLTEQCRELVYEAEDVRVRWVETKREDALRKEQVEAETRRKEAEASMLATLAADRQHALELAKIAAENERLKIQTDGDLASRQMSLSLESKKIDASTSLEQAKINADTDRLAIQKLAETEQERTKAGVETTRIAAGAAVDIAKSKADAQVAVAGKIADLTATKENAELERAKIRAAANVSIASDFSNTIEKVGTERAKAAIEIAKVESSAGIEIARTIAESQKPAIPQTGEQMTVMNGALECGGFYQVMMKNAPKNQRSGIASLADAMFEVARNAGADEGMVSSASNDMLMKIKASAASGRQVLEKDLRSLKERCTTMSDVAKL